ncbi:MAG: ClC family H(+)/Cl(-) exchange transporter [Methanobrevibacter sp.]|nr:ClC family H(+)/Cl(-) exchange transporter [Methanobrevibacter sp.]
MKMIRQTLGLNVENSKYYIKLIIEAILIGLFSGFIVSMYRFGLENSENILFSTLKYIQGDFLLTVAWFVILAIMGLITAILIKWDPSSSGSGIPIVMGEVKGYFDVCWWKTLIAKFISGTLTALGGLSLGREGPSVQLGAMAAKGVSKYLPNSKTDEKRLLVCGSGAGLAATFSAPLAGFIFTLEEINKGFDRSIVLVGLVSALVAGLVSNIFFGQNPIFPFTSLNLPLNYFWLFIVLGIIVGLLGYIYNVGMIKASDLWGKLDFLPLEIKFILVFMVTGIVGLFLPEVLGGGYSMMTLIESSLPPLSILIILLIGKYLLLIFCFGSNAPGGIFYPVLVIGAYIGAIFSAIVIPIFHLNPLIAYKFIMISMAAMFASSVRTPITAVVLISEMTGVTNSLVAMIAVVVLAYIIPTILGNEPIYETLLLRLLKKDRGIDFDKTKSVLEEYVVPMDCALIGQKVWELPIPKTAMVVSVVRSGNTLIPDENLELKYADELFIIMNQNTYSEDNNKIESLIYNNWKEE